MGAALSIFVVLSLSVFVIRVAAVALRLTGLSNPSARFQALSAFTGTGFTTSEAETVVNYPVRRRIVAILMIVGNMGLVTVLATLVVSLVHTEGEAGAVMRQITWLAGGLGLLWFLMLNKTADRLLCSIIGKFLESTTFLGKRRFHRLLQVRDGYSVCEHPVPQYWINDLTGPLESKLERLELSLLAARSPIGENVNLDALTRDHSLVLFGPDKAHDILEGQNSGGSQ